LDIEPDKDKKGNELSKYMSVTGSRFATCYGGDALKSGDDVLIVEGGLDALKAGQDLGKKFTVITFGSASSNIPQVWRKKLAKARAVYSVLDNDDAGQKATRRLDERLGALLGNRLHTLKVPQGKDITDFVVKHQGNLGQWLGSEIAAPFCHRNGIP